MIWFGKSFIKFCKSFINLIKLVSTRSCSSARVRTGVVSESLLEKVAWTLWYVTQECMKPSIFKLSHLSGTSPSNQDLAVTT